MSMAESLRQELRHSLQRRVTVFWRCGETPACSTGILMQVGIDFIEMVGIVPTFSDDEVSLPVAYADSQGLLLNTIIPLKNLCGFIEDVPSGRKAVAPGCGDLAQGSS